MQDPCSRSVFLFFFYDFVVVLYLFFQFLLVCFSLLFFLFSFGPLWVLISGLKPKEAYSKSALTERKYEAY